MSDAAQSSAAPRTRVPPPRDALIRQVQSLANRLNRRPSARELRDVALIHVDDARRVFGGYCGLLRAAGFRGRIRRREIDAERKEEMLDDLGRIIGRLGRFPTIAEYGDHGLFGYRSFKQAFASWKQARAAFLARAGGESQWPETLRALKARQNLIVYEPSPNHSICGTLLNYRAMLHEPTNEQGVVFLFGMMAEELGFMIETVRTAFPDCEGKRRVGPSAWQRVRIEFEFLSSRFNHPVNGCDLIVCWRDDQPRNDLEVIALEKVLRERKGPRAPASEKPNEASPATPQV